MHLLAISLFCLLVRFNSATILNLRPKQIVNSIGLGYRFGGHGSQSTEESDHFKLLEADGDSLLVGARGLRRRNDLLYEAYDAVEKKHYSVSFLHRLFPIVRHNADVQHIHSNAVYNLSVTTLSVHHKIDWKPPADVIEECLMKGKLKSDCQNYIRVLARQSPGKALICGTHAFSPKCREYVYSSIDGTLKNTRQFDGQGISPYDPRDNSTVVYLPDTHEIYTGTVSDFVGNDPLIYRKRIGENDRDNGIRTQRDDARVLDTPNFVGSFVYKEHVYYWYRERAAEAMDNNEERQIYARVARVCRNDKGGARPANERWTSFMKARLNCSLSSATPFYFNELKAVSDPIVSSANDHRVYAVFSTPDSDVRMSAVCAFSMKRIREEFDYGTFKQQRTVNSLWVPYNRNEIPRPRPGACVPDSTKLPEATVSFITRTPLMHRAIESINGPMLIEGSDRADLTQIAVLPHVDSVNGQNYDIIYLGTSDGRVLKLIETVGNTTVIESVTVFSRTIPVVNLLTTPRQLVVVSSDEVATIDVHHCNEPDSCNRCVALQDPHCAWDLTIARCVNRNSWSGGHFIQNIVFGQSEQCPEGIVISEEVNDEPSPERVVDPKRGMHTAESLFLACGLSALIALVIGSFVTYRVTRARVLAEAHHSASSTSGSDYDSFGRARLTRHDSLTTAAKIEHVYGGPPKTSVDASSLVLTMPPAMTMSQHTSGVNTPSRDKNAIMTSINQNTLPRDYKVKKVYL